MRDIRKILLAAGLIALARGAQGQVQTEPVEIITATPLSAFSERSGSWPTAIVPQDEIGAATRPLADSLNEIPGLEAREQGSPTLSIHGSGQADRVLKLLNGIPLNMADGLGASSLFIPLETLGELRLLKGPASVFYGPSAMAGALDHRLREFDHPAVRLSLADDGGEFGRRGFFAALPSKAGEQRSQLTLFADRDPGQFLYDSASGLGSGRRETNSTDTARVTFSGAYRLKGFQVRPILLFAQQSGDLPGPLYAPFPSSFTVRGLSTGAEVFAPTDVEGEALSFRFSDQRLWRDDRDSAGPSSSSTSSSSLAIDWKHALPGSFVMRTFSDARNDSLAATYIGGERLYDADIELGQSFEIPLSSNLTLQPAYRYLPKYGQWLKALGFANTATRWREWLTYTEGFRNPSLSDRFANFTDFVANPGLEPETSQGAEVGVRFEEGRRYGGFLDGFALSALAHATRYQNLFTTAGVGGNSIRKVNSGEARAGGIDVDAGYGFSVWTIDLAEAYLDSRDEATGASLRLAPRHQTSLTVSNQMGPALIELRDTLWSSYIDQDTANVSHELPGWNTLDLNIRTIGLADWEFRAGIYDIFNSSRELTYGYPEAQRRFYLSALRFL